MSIRVLHLIARLNVGALRAMWSC
ncbi:hypothetical protein DFAR_1350007 [Desulfarculales bacterium]